MKTGHSSRVAKLVGKAKCRIQFELDMASLNASIKMASPFHEASPWFRCLNKSMSAAGTCCQGRLHKTKEKVRVQVKSNHSSPTVVCKEVSALIDSGPVRYLYN